MKFLVVFLFFLFSELTLANCVTTLDVTGPISMGTHDSIQRALVQANKDQCGSLLLKINTPGGSLLSSRKIVEEILNSSIPVLCMITPQGGHAGSAGAIIMQACHVSGALSATNIGAATPISGDGKSIAEDMRNKIVNDTVSWMEGVTKLRSRNLEFSRDMITKGTSLTSEEAVKLGAIDFLVNSESEFLEKAAGKEVLLGKDLTKHQVTSGELKVFEKDLRAIILDFIADPEFAYLIFMGSLALLYAEITNPGLMVPGVLGALGLMLSLVAFHKLNVEWGGLALILLGIGLMVAEIFITSFGVLGIGGLVAIFVGSVLLFDVASTGFTLSLGVIAPVVILLASIFFGLGFLMLKTLKLKSTDRDDDLKQQPNRVISVAEDGLSGKIEVLGEIWNFTSAEVVEISDVVEILERDSFVLKIRKK